MTLNEFRREFFNQREVLINKGFEVDCVLLSYKYYHDIFVDCGMSYRYIYAPEIIKKGAKPRRQIDGIDILITTDEGIFKVIPKVH